MEHTVLAQTKLDTVTTYFKSMSQAKLMCHVTCVLINNGNHNGTYILVARVGQAGLYVH